jgi:hypothetical protein
LPREAPALRPIWKSVLSWSIDMFRPHLFHVADQPRLGDFAMPVAAFNAPSRAARVPASRREEADECGALDGWGFQRQGYGHAAMREVIRRLRLDPQVQLIGTRHRRDNEAAANLYRNLGFGPWKVPWQNADPDEVYVALHDVGRAGL